MAENVPYTPFPSITPTVDGLPMQSVPADEESFGAGIGRGLQRTGAVLRRAQDAENALSLQFAQQQIETQALDASTEYTRQSNAIVNQYRQLNGQQAVEAFPSVEKQLAELNKGIAKGLKSPLAQRIYKSRSEQMLSSSLMVAGGHAAEQGSAAAEAAKVGAISAAQSRFVNHFGLAPTEPDIAEIVGLTAQLAFERGLPKEATDVLIQKNVGDALANVMGVKIAKGQVGEAKAILEESYTQKIPGTDIPIFSGDEFARLSGVMKAAEEAQALDELQAQQRAHALGEAQRRQTQDDFLKKMTAGKLTATEVLGSNLDPFGSGSKEQFLEMLKVGVSGGEMKTNNELYIELFNRIHAPDGFPGKITDENDLNQYMGRGLTPTSITQLRGEITGRRTQEGSVEGDLKKQFIDAAKGQISGSNPLFGIADPKGDEQFYRFMQYFLPAYDKAVRAGGDPSELLDPNGIFAKSILQYKREPAQWGADMQSAPAGPVPGTPAPVPAVAPPGVNVPISPRPNLLPQGAGVMKMGTAPYPVGTIVPANSNPRDTDEWPSGIQMLPTKITEGGRTFYILLPAHAGEADAAAIERYKAAGPDAKQFGKFDTAAARDAQAKKLMRPTVKFSPKTQSWWWQEGGEWKSSPTRPTF